MATPAKNNTTKIEKNKLGSLITPIGSALFVSVPHASKFNEDQQEAGIVLSAEAYAEFESQVEALIDALEEPLVCKRELAKLNGKAQTDAEGNPTGDILLKAKTGMQYPCKTYDAQNKAFVPDMSFSVPNRSKIRLQVSVETYKSNLTAGITLKLNAIKIITSTPWAGGDVFGGTDDEGDYSYNPGQATVAPEADLDWAEA